MLPSTGHQFNMDAKISYIQQSVNVNYNIPGRHPLTQQYHIFAASQKYSDVRTGQFYTFGKLGASYVDVIREGGGKSILS